MSQETVNRFPAIDIGYCDRMGCGYDSTGARNGLPKLYQGPSDSTVNCILK